MVISWIWWWCCGYIGECRCWKYMLDYLEWCLGWWGFRTLLTTYSQMVQRRRVLCTVPGSVGMRSFKNKTESWKLMWKKLYKIKMYHDNDSISIVFLSPPLLFPLCLFPLFSFTSFLPFFYPPFSIIPFHTFLFFLPSLFLSHHYVSNVTYKALTNFPGGERKILHTKKWWIL